MHNKKFINIPKWLVGLTLLVIVGLVAGIGLILVLVGPKTSLSPTTTKTTIMAAPKPTSGLTPAIAPTQLATPGAAPVLARDVKTQLDASWADYSKRFIQADGRVMDPQQAALTTSEGQSYALLRAVWENDRDSFQRVLSWTQGNLQTRVNDKLFAFKWGQSSDGQWHVLDKNNASDADSDIALALLFAAKSWSDTNYQQLGLQVVTSLWEKSVVTVKNKPYLTAGDWAVSQDHPALNPSYLSPYAYRIFATYDPAHDWSALVDTSYEVIQACSTVNLAGLGGNNLPPNFCGINKENGTFTTAQDYPSLNTNYGYDAFRTSWRVALDYKWFGDKRALDYLTANHFPRDVFKQTGKLDTEYDHSGKPLTTGEDLAVYGGTLGNFAITDPKLADSLVTTKLLPAYKQVRDPDFARAYVGWGDPRNYYNQNWVWFGLALYSGNLPNLAATPSIGK